MFDFKKAALSLSPLLLAGCASNPEEVETRKESFLQGVDEEIRSALQADTDESKPVIRAGKSIAGNFNSGTYQFTATNTSDEDSKCGHFNVVVTYERGSGRTETVFGPRREICLL